MKRVLVTGGTGVLGAALVKAFVDESWCVTANFFVNLARAQGLQRAINCQLARADVSCERDVKTLFETPFDAVIHLAARSNDALLPRTTNAIWQQSRRDLDAAFLLTRAALQHLPRGGHLILVSSRVALRGNIGQCAYAAHKSAVLGLMRSAAIEGRDREIRVNAVCPGFASSTLSSALSPEMKANRESENLVSHPDTAQSFAAFCVWLTRSNQSGKVWRPDCRI